MAQRVKAGVTKGDSQRLAQTIAEAAADKKAEDIVVLDLRKLDSVADFFVICTGDVDQHVRAIADHVQEEVRKITGEKVLHREGRESLNWVLLDYVDVVAHVMKPAYREYYRLEDLWGDADALRLKNKRATPEAGASKAKKPAAKAKPKPTRPVVKKPRPAPAKRATKPGAKTVRRKKPE